MSLQQQASARWPGLRGRNGGAENTLVSPADTDWARCLAASGETGATPLTLLLAPLEDTLAQTGHVLSTDGFVALDGEWRFTHVNAEAERVNGIPREDQIGKSQSEETLHKTHSDLERRVRERTRQLSRANARLERQVAERRKVEEARTDLLRRLVGAQEEERRRIARELHDDLTQRLAVLAIDAGALEQMPNCPQDVKERARDMHGQLVALSESVHSLSRQLHPAILDDLGLVDALRSECLSLKQRDGLTVKYCTRDVPADLPRGVALCVYRVAQEALRNVVRHARSPRASVRLVTDGGELVLRVRDRGVGFEMAAPGRSGLGLESMRERARLIRARLTVHSRPGEGTRVTVRVPLHRSQP